MLARCARCQGTFTTEKFGVQSCPHCGSEILLSDPSGAPPPPPAAPAASPPGAAPTQPMQQAAPPPGAPPPQAGWGPPPPGWSPPPPQGWGPVGGPPPPPQERPSPFAERARLGFFASYFETMKLVATQPQEFFGRVRIDQAGPAILFGVIGASVGNAAAVLYGFVTRAATLSQLQARLGDMPPQVAAFMEQLVQAFEATTSPAATAVQVMLTPLLALVGIYLSAGLVHLALMLFKGAGRGFQATLTVTAYASGLYLMAALPSCGGMVAMVWYLVALIIGLGAAHRTGPLKPALAVFAPLLLLCACCCAILGIGGAGFFKAAAEAAAAAKGKPTSL
jgi:hypothetical protein